MNFFKTFLAALLAIVVANILIFIFGIMIFAGISSIFNESVPTVGRGSILRIDFTEGVTDSPSDKLFSSVGIGGIRVDNSNSVLQVLDAIERAAYDPNIEGIFINITGGLVSLSNIEEIRNGLEYFKTSGKFIVGYSDNFSQIGYYLNSVADMVFINPEGGLMWQGMSSAVLFYKGLLEKLGIRPEIIRHGEFKAAVEPFILDGMSPENRRQTEELLNTIWGSILEDISYSRGVDSLVLSNYASNLSVRNPSDALQYGLVDGLLYEDQVYELMDKLISGKDNIRSAYEDVIRDDRMNMRSDGAEGENVVTTGRKKKDVNLKFVSLPNYIAATSTFTRSGEKNRVAVIYVDGDIVDGYSQDGSVGGNTISAKLCAALEDDEVKAVVLRVNSPGGSALASEVMWREVERLKQEKPVIVSMGGVAASGGYYISCGADVILVNRSTITGSIGVFGVLMDVSKGLKDKLGVTVDVVKTNPSADFGSALRPVTPFEREVLMEQIEKVYGTFIGHVADGRNLNIDYVDGIGGGRVWSGVSSIDIGLADGYGGIKDAIALAADRAGIAESFKVWEMVDRPDNITSLVKSLGRVSVKTDEMGEMRQAWKHYETVQKVIENTGVQARMPYILDIQ